MSDSREHDKFVVRLPEGLRPEIAAVARLNHRSMNGEIINRLQRTLILEQLQERQSELIAQLLKRIDTLESKEASPC
ncbi:DNA-binding protein [Pseudomonas sp. NS1(2017)]|uniref:Arc family DNA-binding protein n=1 Tax=Pseudomonas sp. NS1(2017) TaxID=2025658 RepID=UPI000BA1D3A5|nr:Arc family DNA-binding protein [Pseudomonas sp. NS1(2017)]ASV35288.1 DNA-binding protein [Pseudomonas sp. NS1(2017)]